MQKFSSLVGSVNSTISLVVKIRSNWKEIAGDVIAAHCTPVHIKAGTLYVVCDSPLWVQQMGLLAPQIIPRIKQYTRIRKLEKIDVRFGMLEKSSIKTPQPIKKKIDPPDIDKTVLARIKDQEIKQCVEKLLEIQGKNTSDS